MARGGTHGAGHEHEAGRQPRGHHDADAWLPVREEAAHGHGRVYRRAHDDHALGQRAAQECERVLGANADEDEHFLVVLDHHAVNER